jgi:hypothetical protein
MPKILINEVDLTSPGTPGRYGNFSVLIAGYAGEPKTSVDERQKPDENGVYEFSSAQAFEDTIGLADVKKIEKDKDGNEIAIKTEYSYGNRMAYELLNLGYPVIYKVIESVREMTDENFWAIFKDKASYDFRFVSHGLLEARYDPAYEILCNKRNAMEEDLKALKDIEVAAGIFDDPDTFTMQQLKACDEAFAEKLAENPNFGHFSNVRDASTNPDGIYEVAYRVYHVAAGFTLPEGITDLSSLTEEDLKKVGKKDTVDGGIYGELNSVKESLKEKDAESFTVGLFNEINGNIARLASYRANDDGIDMPAYCDGRGDCIALIELDENAYVRTETKERPETLIIKGIQNMSSSIGEEGAFCAMTVPSVYYKMSNDKVKFPGAFHYLTCFMNSISSGFAEWYAAAGYNRGVSSYFIDHTSVKLGEIAINALEPRYLVDDPQKVQPPFACNVIANFRGSYYLWGNRTAALLNSKAGGGDLTAQHFLNVRQLCATLKKQVYVTCRRFTFDPNSDTLWFNFVNAITPTLDAMKADQGIRDYKIVKIFTDKKATLKARIRIIPIEAVEDFDITIALEDSFGGVAVTTAG